MIRKFLDQLYCKTFLCARRVPGDGPVPLGHALRVILLLVLAASPVLGQVRLRGPQRGTRNLPPEAVVIEPSAPVENLFARAEEGIARRDWKFAIDSLQRIIDYPDGSLLPLYEEDDPIDELYESAGRRAIRVLASLPYEGQAAYRLIYDGMAKRLLNAGRRKHDPKPLRTLVTRFLLTQYADEAIDLLTSWALDAGRPGEVIALLSDLSEFVPGFDAPGGSLDSKLAVAYALLGRDEQARGVVDRLRTENGGHPFRVKQLVDALETIKRAGFAEVERKSAGWPVTGGTPDRRGRMPETEPMLTGPVPWNVQLAGARPDAWRRVFGDGLEAPLVLPIGRLISDGTRLFARTRLGCTALGVDTLKVLWDARLDTYGTATPAQPPGRRRGPTGTWAPPHSDEGSLFEDYVAGDISLAGDLVTVISRSGRTEYTFGHRDFRNEGLIAWALNPIMGTRAIRGTRLVAFDRVSGEIRWSRGRSGEPNDPLGDVLFRSTPLQVGPNLWITFSRNNDLYVGVLDPRDGALITKIPLGSVINVQHSMPPVLPLAAWDGLVFIPSGHGVLFAVNVFDYSVRWAHEYAVPYMGARARMEEGSDGWLPSPPIVAGGKLLVAPPFGHRLYAFEAVSGEVEWSTAFVKSQYLFAADAKRVWVGGRTIACADVNTGEVLWQTSLNSPPTGRAVLSGEKILIPGLDGLTTLDAKSGELLGVAELLAGEPPLGNLLCFHNAVYSLQSGTVRKYPDVDRSYPAALQAFEEDPTRTPTALSLAWLELLRGDPQRAFDILEDLSATDRPGDSNLEQEIAHARVEALLSMAGRRDPDGRTPKAVLDLLEAAVAEARIPTDRLRCTMAVADQLVAMGRPSDAYRRLWSFGAGPEADIEVTLSHQVYGRARGLIGKRLLDILSTSSEAEVSELRAFRTLQSEPVLERVLLGKGDGGDRTTLRAMADLGSNEAAEQRLLLALACDHANHNHFARAEQLLRESVACNSSPTLVAAANLLLAEWKAGAVQNGYGSAFVLQEHLKILADQHGNVSVQELHSAVGEQILPARLTGSVNDWIASLRRDFQLPESIQETSRGGNEAVQFGVAPVWSIQAERQLDQPRLIHFDRSAALAFDDRYLSLDPSETLRCYRCSDRDLIWETDLRVPGTFKTTIRARWPDGEGVVRHGVIDGQTVLISTRSGVFAIELGTGRRLWIQPYDFGEHLPGAGRLERRMALGDGVAACMLRPGRISLLRVSDGQPLWERDLLGERVGSIKMWRDRLIVADPFMARVHLLDRHDGSVIRRLHFHQPDPQNYFVNLVRVGDLLCGLQEVKNSETVTAVDLVTGETRWQVPLDKPVVQMFRAANGYLGIGLLGGDVWIVDTDSGEVVLDRRVAKARGVVRGVLVDGTLVLQYFNLRGSARVLEMAGFDVATDVELWRRDDVIPLWSSGESIGIVGGSIPVVLHTGGTARNKRMPLKATMLDIRTGAAVGPAPPVPRATRLSQFQGDFILLPHSGIAILGMETGIHAFKVNVTKNNANRDF